MPGTLHPKPFTFYALLSRRRRRRGSSTRLSVAAGAEWVRAPIEIRSGPAAAIARTFFNVIPPDTSTTALPLDQPDSLTDGLRAHVIQ